MTSTLLNTTLQTSKIQFSPTDNHRLAQLCGQFNEHLHFIENALDVQIHHRGNLFHIIGQNDAVKKARHLLEKLYQETQQPDQLNKEKIYMLLKAAQQSPKDAEKKSRHISTPRCVITTCSNNQRKYIDNIHQYDINFSIGPAGTGKTYLAVACAVEALEKEIISRIILVRPAVEAGERLGFLPGDLSQKVDPYLRPLYDALYEMLGVEKVAKLIEQNVIEIAPLAYMRGRTLNESFIILDEGQNTTKAQMKMFLTRIGFASKAVITGDLTQIDLVDNKDSGLKQVETILKKISAIGFSYFDSTDVVRHPLVQDIIDAYENHEKDSK